LESVEQPDVVRAYAVDAKAGEASGFGDVVDGPHDRSRAQPAGSREEIRVDQRVVRPDFASADTLDLDIQLLRVSLEQKAARDVRRDRFETLDRGVVERVHGAVGR